MGRDKARLKLGGATMLSLIRRTAAGLGHPVRTIRRDRIPRCGPLGGIYTGLLTSRADAELFLACDMPGVEATLLERMITNYFRSNRPIFTRAGRRAGFPFVLPRQLASLVRGQIDQGKFSVQELASALNAEFLELPKAQSGQLLNINTPAQWAEALRLWTRPKSTACK